MRRLRDGEVGAGAGGVALLAALFLHWYDLESSGAGWTRYGPPPQALGTAWEAFGVLDVVLALLALAPLALVVTQATRRSPSIPVMFSVLTTVAGALAVVLILYRIVNQPGANEFVDVEVGAWLGVLAAFVIAFGGWRSMRVEPVPGTPLPPIEDLPEPAAT
jgi:carbon starvation protein CstA